MMTDIFSGPPNNRPVYIISILMVKLNCLGIIKQIKGMAVSSTKVPDVKYPHIIFVMQEKLIEWGRKELGDKIMFDLKVKLI